MFRQALTNSSRALRSAAPRLAASNSVGYAPFRVAPAVFQQQAVMPSIGRWYSDAKAEETKEAKEETKEGNGEADPVAELKKQLEAKDSEAREWKVCEYFDS